MSQTGLAVIDRDIKLIAERAGPIRLFPPIAAGERPADFEHYVTVSGGFNVKERLKAIGFKWDETEKIWHIRVSSNKHQHLLAELYAIVPSQTISTRKSDDFRFERTQYLKVFDATADAPSALQTAGFSLREGPPTYWVKKVTRAELDATVTDVFTISRELSIDISLSP